MNEIVAQEIGMDYETHLSLSDQDIEDIKELSPGDTTPLSDGKTTATLNAADTTISIGTKGFEKDVLIAAMSNPLE